jgi:predicted polyphosphate/ATP-dependent NAD kinase
MAGLVGLIVNPVAGAGGRVGLHGTDGPAVLAEAVRRGGSGRSTPRAVRALRRLAESPDCPAILAAPGAMGADVAAACGVQVTGLELRLPADGVTAAEDTRRAARQLAKAGVDLLLFAGGDGTARDVEQAIGTRLPMLGIPAGVKMRSGVFGTSPEAAAELVSEYLGSADRPCADAEILDLAADGEHSEFYSVARVPALSGGRLAGPKGLSPAGLAVELDALCAAAAADLEPGTLYLFGPGSTTGGVLRKLGVQGSMLGIDAVQDGRLIGSDLPEQSIMTLMDAAPAAKLVLGVIGGQGFLLGRGNQQLSPAVLDRIGPAGLVILASTAKLAALDPPRLLIDAGDEVPVRGLCGYHRVRTGPARYMMMQVTTAA